MAWALVRASQLGLSQVLGTFLTSRCCQMGKLGVGRARDRVAGV